MQVLLPHLTSDTLLGRNLLSGNNTLVLETIDVLLMRRELSFVDRVRPLLERDDAGVQFYAARYLGWAGDSVAVPYLIWYLQYLTNDARSVEVAALLKARTGRDFGRDQRAWDAWWKSVSDGHATSDSALTERP